MKTPPSSLFTPLSLTNAFNVERANLPDSLRFRFAEDQPYGAQEFQGIPFQLGLPGEANAVLLDRESRRIDLNGITGRFLVFLHACEDRPTVYQEGFADTTVDGSALGEWVSDYVLEYADGTSESTRILRRFAIQQPHIIWGASAFEAVPAPQAQIFPTVSQEQILGRVPTHTYGVGETRQASARDAWYERHNNPPVDFEAELLWLYALANPHPEKPIRSLNLVPREARSIVCGISYTDLVDHPLRPGLRRKLLLSLPPGLELNALGELESLGMDLGEVISASGALQYDRSAWESSQPEVRPARSAEQVIVEYAAHPRAKLYVPTPAGECLVHDLSDSTGGAIVHVNPASRPVRLRIVEKGSTRPVAARLHMHGAVGEYLPVRGHHRQVNPYWFEDNYAEFVNGMNQYCYVPGECVADLPLGEVFVEITRGYEVAPIRTRLTVTPETDEVTFELRRSLQWRRAGWVTADTHVHFLSPQTALLEGTAEGVNVVNLLASQWGEMFSSVGDFDGRTTFGAREFGGDGEFLVRVGTENRMQVLGHISLLGYSGEMIHPLCSAGPSESALGDPLEVTMAGWARRCLAQGGLVVLPHAPHPQCERAADLVLGVVNAVEMMSFNPFDAQLNRDGLADWYRHLNVGNHVPLVGGSDKMSAASLLGGMRTYAHLVDMPLTYVNWMAAVRAGNTFATVGPLVELSVEGQPPGRTVNLPSSGGSVNVNWKVESVSLMPERLEIIMGGAIVEQVDLRGKEKKGLPLTASGSLDIPIARSTWIALRLCGSYRGRAGDIAAHTSAVFILVGDKPLFVEQDASAILQQVEGAIRYVETIAPIAGSAKYEQLCATLQAAHARMHARLNQPS